MIINDKDTFITLALDNKPHYTTRVSLLNKPFNIQCSYNTRNKLRWIIITDLNNNPVLSQTFVKNKKQCELNHLSNRYGLKFYVTLKQKDKSKIIPNDYDYLDWANDFDLYFVGRSQDTQNRLLANLREVLVGG